MRTQDEIKERFEKVNDFFGTQKADLAQYLEYEYAKLFLTEEAILAHESGEDVWVTKTDPKKEILEYLDFAYEKAEDERGLSAQRSLLHFNSWIWLDSEELYQEFQPLINPYTNYGIPALNWISEKYGFVRKVAED